jgi:preprotein translocase subunit SecA
MVRAHVLMARRIGAVTIATNIARRGSTFSWAAMSISDGWFSTGSERKDAAIAKIKVSCCWRRFGAGGFRLLATERRRDRRIIITSWGRSDVRGIREQAALCLEDDDLLRILVPALFSKKMMKSMPMVKTVVRNGCLNRETAQKKGRAIMIAVISRWNMTMS